MNNVIYIEEWKEKKEREFFKHFIGFDPALNSLFVAGEKDMEHIYGRYINNNPFPQWCEIFESEEAE